MWLPPLAPKLLFKQQLLSRLSTAGGHQEQSRGTRSRKVRAAHTLWTAKRVKKQTGPSNAHCIIERRSAWRWEEDHVRFSLNRANCKSGSWCLYWIRISDHRKAAGHRDRQMRRNGAQLRRAPTSNTGGLTIPRAHQTAASSPVNAHAQHMLARCGRGIRQSSCVQRVAASLLRNWAPWRIQRLAPSVLRSRAPLLQGARRAPATAAGHGADDLGRLQARRACLC